MKSIIRKSAILFLSLGVMAGCVNEDDYSAPNLDCVDPGLTANKSVADVKNAATSAPVLYTADDIIEGYVTSNDEKGNFFKTVYLQTKPTDGSAPIGFSVPLDVTTMYGEGFTPGKKVYVKLNGLHVAVVDGILSIGQLFQPTPEDAPEIGRIAEADWKRFLFISCDQPVSEETLVRQLPVTQSFTNAALGTLIEIPNVQFGDASIGRTYYDIDSGGGATNHTLVSSATPALTVPNNSVIRFSSFASFADELIPSGSGSIRGVMTKFGSTFQFTIRSLSDVKLTGPRVDPFPPVVGNAIVFEGSFTENFESYTAGSNTTGQFNFPRYINDPVVGTRFWRVRSNGTPVNKFIQMTSFGGTPENNRTLFIVPVDMTAANTFKFQTRTSFVVQNSLKVYYSTNYTPGADVNAATLVDISSSFAISNGSNATGPFLDSGIYNIPANLTGNGYFIFEYTGTGLTTPPQTTNMDIDNIVVN